MRPRPRLMSGRRRYTLATFGIVLGALGGGWALAWALAWALRRRRQSVREATATLRRWEDDGGAVGVIEPKRRLAARSAWSSAPPRQPVA
jgi:hypothetical protein